MEIKRDSYLKQLISYRFDGLVKVITGIRRCGKSYLLKNIYRDYLIENGVKEEQIITIESKKNRDITSYIIYAPRLNHQYFSVSLCMYAGFPVILGCL